MSSTANSRVKETIVLPVVEAANNRDVLTCRRLLDTSTSFNDTARPLLNAVANGLEVAVETLLNLGCDVNEKGGFKDISFEFFSMSCLHIAVMNEDLNIVKRLLDAGCDANAVDQYSLTPLHWACKYGNAKVVEWLLKYGKNIDINRQSAEGLCALHTAVKYNHTDVVKLLIKAGKSIADQIRLSVPENLRCSMHFACVVRNNMGVEGCFYEPPKKMFPETMSSSLSMAIANRNIDVFRLLIKAGAFKIMNMDDKMKLSEDVVKCKNEEFLLDILRAAADLNDVFILDEILSRAIRYDNKTFVEILHRFGADFNVCDSDGMLPIHLASTASPRVLEYLLKNGVDVNARTIGVKNSSKTALIYASASLDQSIDTGEMKLELLKMLISGGAKLNLVDRHGRSALFNTVLAYFEFLYGKLGKIKKQKLVSVSTDMICLLLMEGATVPPLQFWYVNCNIFIFLFSTLQPHHNVVFHSMNSVITWLRLGSHYSIPLLYAYLILFINLFCYAMNLNISVK